MVSRRWMITFSGSVDGGETVEEVVVTDIEKMKNVGGFSSKEGDRGFLYWRKEYRDDANENGIKWSNSDVQSFISIDHIHGPVVENARKAAKVATIGSAVGALHLGGTAWRYSKSPHGAVLAVGLGAVVGYTVGKEAASHYYQLYPDDAMASQVKFLEWIVPVVDVIVISRWFVDCTCSSYCKWWCRLC
ncbi:succinate dehydrogenase subunit 6, mitochondrial-like [Papaver somniferum]|uniref:succinate dehydrogenase subunit 6, mitochondrial-like n=1 Tax=Papaver somniferum TaxID=3469 RepID=UPI000E7057AB|nr:succinate dehydrogenase subunit 6, mitochondrial-like [Papaver somniferum]